MKVKNNWVEAIVEIHGYKASLSELKKMRVLTKEMEGVLNTTWSEQDGRLLGTKTAIEFLPSIISGSMLQKNFRYIRILTNDYYLALEITKAFRAGNVKIDGQNVPIFSGGGLKVFQ